MNNDIKYFYFIVSNWKYYFVNSTEWKTIIIYIYYLGQVVVHFFIIFFFLAHFFYKYYCSIYYIIMDIRSPHDVDHHRVVSAWCPPQQLLQLSPVNLPPADHSKNRIKELFRYATDSIQEFRMSYYYTVYT